MHRFLKFLTSRTFLIGVLVLAQIGLYLALFVAFGRATTYAYVLITILTVLIIVAVMERTHTNPAYKIMWILLVVGMPFSGAAFYLLWGSRVVRPKKAAQFARIEQRVNEALRPDMGTIRALCAEDASLTRSVEYLVAYANAPVYAGTECRYFSMGQDFFPVFLEQLRAAKKFIYMEYFIIDDSGTMWSETLEILRQKAAEGVDVRIIYDGAGSLFTLPNDYDETLRRMGIKCYAFNPLRFSWHLTDYKMLNNRDHRKITVIDGEVGFSGGLNFADEYINRKKRFGTWKDTSFMLHGPAVYSLTLTFLRMWDFVAGVTSLLPTSAPAALQGDAVSGYVQPYCDSPLDEENVSENAYFNILQSAQSYVYLTTPYLIVDHEMVTCLCLAAKSGVDVRIIVPGIPDKWYAYYVTQSYYAELLQAGVRIYEYTPGFIHAKMYVSDDRVAIVGSANMDYRSLYLHFENCCAFYGGHMVQDVKADILHTLAESREVTQADTENIPLHKWLAQIFFRFFAPLM